MAHFAYVVDGVVKRVHVVANAVITDSEGVEQEASGQEFLANLHGLVADNFIQCSYNASMRGVYPGPGFAYDPVADLFVAPEPAEVPDEAV
jgi:hypothetical protein